MGSDSSSSGTQSSGYRMHSFSATGA
jgi:hypothetical protein